MENLDEDDELEANLDLSEITILIDDEEQTLYVGPVDIEVPKPQMNITGPEKHVKQEVKKSVDVNQIVNRMILHDEDEVEDDFSNPKNDKLLDSSSAGSDSGIENMDDNLEKDTPHNEDNLIGSDGGKTVLVETERQSKQCDNVDDQSTSPGQRLSNDQSNVDKESNEVQYECVNCKAAFKSMCWYTKHTKKCDKSVMDDDIPKPPIFEINPNKRKGRPKKLRNTADGNSIKYGNDVEIMSNIVLKSPSPRSQTPLTCTICDMKFSKRFSLVSHTMRVHKKEKQKTCKYCGRQFAYTGDLTRHIRIHTGDKPFKCVYPGCKYAFISSGDLNKHARRHTKDVMPIPRPFICAICHKDFERTYDLKRHMARHKLDDPNYTGFQCDICSKKFCRKDQFRSHQNRHTGVKPHRCTVCNKAFADQSNCTKHMKQHTVVAGTNENEFICHFCHEKFTKKKSISRHMTNCTQRLGLKGGSCEKRLRSTNNNKC